MSQPPTIIEDVERTEDTWWRKLITPIARSFRNPCNRESLELGIELTVVTYLITVFGLKRPQSAFKYSMVAFMTVPLINWPICVAQKAELTPREL